MLSAFFTTGCGAIEGEVRDGVNGRPVADAVITLHYSADPSGFISDGRSMTTTTGESGAFTFKRDNGHRLEVTAQDGRRATGSVCARSPFTVFVGSPYPGLRLNRPLILSRNGSPPANALDDERRLDAGDLGLSVSRADGSDGASFTFAADQGLVFVEGTGSVPLPPPLPYPDLLALDLGTVCGWIFVARQGRAAAVIEARAPQHLAMPGGYEEISLLFAELP